jgi:hypothetical protein
MWIMLVTGSYGIYTRPGRATRGKWRIPDVKDECGLDHKFEAPMVVAPA